MRWQPGDVAIIESTTKRGGEYCILRRRFEDEDGGNDYFYTEVSGKKRVIPCAWIVEMINRHLDCCLVAESCLIQAGNPNSQVEWADCDWQPVEYIKYP